MKFCSQCGSADMQFQVPAGDNRPRHVCQRCDTVFYENPKIVAGCIPVWGEQVLLCKRAIEPRYGYWTLPAGFMEIGETTPEAALRETVEEAGARVTITALHTLINLPQVNQVYVMFLSELTDLDFAPGEESLEVALYREDEIPWQELAFPTIEHTLKFYYADRQRGSYGFHTGDIIRRDGRAEFHVRRDQ
ncbi:MAG: NUDIX hydrolase [Gammaproteobacteria bacterium]|nr:NUDIX hydrolase [Gammaproteobacteria bacterium]NNM00114.1 NUDIX hydrolase [Gammaproteobacteria bacterium]